MVNDYLKAVCANKVTLFGYLGIIGVTGVEIAVHAFDLLGPKLDSFGSEVAFAWPLYMVPFIPLIVTAFGAGTLDTYRRTKKHIEKFGKLDKRFSGKLSGDYCDRRGVRLAVKESKLEKWA